MDFVKRLLNSSSNVDGPDKTLDLSPNVERLSSFLQEKFSKGVDFNLKVVIRGDRGVGKSTLLARLKGESFCCNRSYVPTDQIQVATINWNYSKNPASIIKVECWDVVDKGRRQSAPQPSSALSSFGRAKHSQPTLLIHNGSGNGQQNLQGFCLDASFVNVYKGTHGVILMFDVANPKTFDYVVRELDIVPTNLPVLVLANFYNQPTSLSDRGNLNCTTSKENESSSTGRPLPVAFVDWPDVNRVKLDAFFSSRLYQSGQHQFYAASLTDRQVLVFIYHFLALPFLHLRRSQLMAQVDRVEGELTTKQDELKRLAVDSGLSSRVVQPITSSAAAAVQDHQRPLILDLDDCVDAQSIALNYRTTTVAANSLQQRDPPSNNSNINEDNKEMEQQIVREEGESSILEEKSPDADDQTSQDSVVLRH